MQKLKIPKVRGPYSHAMQAGDFLFISGQLPFNPESEELVERTIEAQAKQVLDNIEAILQAHALTFADVVKVEIYLKNMGDAPKLNELYAARFQDILPARQMMEVAKLPLDVLVEISCIAHRK